MCMMVYIASDCPLPTSEWDKAQPRFHVIELNERDEPVRLQFSKPCVYYVGSHEGCGCGFQYGQYEGIEDDPAQLASAQESRRLLAEFVSNALLHQPTVELFACWDGDQGAVPEHRVCLRPLDLIQKHTFFREKELLIISETGG